MPETAVIFGGIAGYSLSDAERRFYADANPWGYILFERNCGTADQVRALTDSLRDLSGRDKVPILIDQEGGRVVRMRDPEWRKLPPGACFGACYTSDQQQGLDAIRLNSRLLGKELYDAGINVDCLPVLDVPLPDGHDVIGDRAYGDDPDVVATLGREAAEGLLDQGVLPVVKHMPGHGRTLVDTHFALPTVTASLDELRQIDFAPFKALADLPLGMTGHLIFDAIDPDNPATLSKKVISEIIRGDIGFDGLLMTDDITMKALGGSMAERTARALAAGCDVVLHCNGDVPEMEEVMQGARPLNAAAMARAERALSRLSVRQAVDWDKDLAHFNELINPHLA